MTTPLAAIRPPAPSRPPIMSYHHSEAAPAPSAASYFHIGDHVLFRIKGNINIATGLRSYIKDLDNKIKLYKGIVRDVVEDGYDVKVTDEDKPSVDALDSINIERLGADIIVHVKRGDLIPATSTSGGRRRTYRRRTNRRRTQRRRRTHRR